MKISNSKKQLARIISENGGWRDGAEWAVQGLETMLVGFSKTVPYRRGCGWFIKGETPVATFKAEHVITNWRQTVLARDEYFHLYPAPDADGGESLGSSVGRDNVLADGKINTGTFGAMSLPTIEQLASEYRAKLTIAQQAQEEADSHRCGAGAALERLVEAGKALGLSIVVAIK